MENIELIPVEGHNALGRDPQSNAILNTDMSGYEAYKKARQNAPKKDRDMQNLRKEIWLCQLDRSLFFVAKGM